MPHWQTSMRKMEKLWGFSSQSSPPTSLVGENKHFKETDIIISVFLWFVQKKYKKKQHKKCFSHRLSFLLFTESTKNDYHCDFYNYLAGSTDFGNVSFVAPGIHPFFYISTDAFNHTEEYTKAAGTAARVYWEQMFVSPNEIELHCDQMIPAINSFQVTWFNFCLP